MADNQRENQNIWYQSCANKFGRLAQDVGTIIPKSTKTIFFIHKHKVPHDCKATYARFVIDICPQKMEKHQTKITVGVNLVHYPGEVHTPTADITLTKLLFNSVISTKNAIFCTIDIKDFYLNMPMKQYEYMKVLYTLVPYEIKCQYELGNKVHDRHVYIEIRKRMYNLPQAGRIAHTQLVKHLENIKRYYLLPHC